MLFFSEMTNRQRRKIMNVFEKVSNPMTIWDMSHLTTILNKPAKQSSMKYYSREYLLTCCRNIDFLAILCCVVFFIHHMKSNVKYKTFSFLKATCNRIHSKFTQKLMQNSIHEYLIAFFINFVHQIMFDNWFVKK